MENENYLIERRNYCPSLIGIWGEYQEIDQRENHIIKSGQRWVVIQVK